MADRIASAIGIPVGLAGAFTISRCFHYSELVFAFLVGAVFGRRIWRVCTEFISDARSRAALRELRSDPHATASAEEVYRGIRNEEAARRGDLRGIWLALRRRFQ